MSNGFIHDMTGVNSDERDKKKDDEELRNLNVAWAICVCVCVCFCISLHHHPFEMDFSLLKVNSAITFHAFPSICELPYNSFLLCYARVHFLPFHVGSADMNKVAWIKKSLYLSFHGFMASNKGGNEMFSPSLFFLLIILMGMWMGKGKQKKSFHSSLTFNWHSERKREKELAWQQKPDVTILFFRIMA